MALIIPYSDPTDITEIADAYLWCIEFNMNFLNKYGRIVYGVFRNEESATQGKRPLGTIVLDITPEGSPAEHDSDPNTGEPILVRDAIPSFDELMQANQTAYGLIRESVYTLALNLPTIFPGASAPAIQ